MYYTCVTHLHIVETVDALAPCCIPNMGNSGFLWSQQSYGCQLHKWGIWYQWISEVRLQGEAGRSDRLPLSSFPLVICHTGKQTHKQTNLCAHVLQQFSFWWIYFQVKDQQTKSGGSFWSVVWPWSSTNNMYTCMDNIPLSYAYTHIRWCILEPWGILKGCLAKNVVTFSTCMIKDFF